MRKASVHLDQRRRVHDRLAAQLAALSDDQVAALLAETATWRVNVHGNQSGVIEFEGEKVFLKKIALTDLERTAENQGSTANLFGLPLFYQYGVGSSGFGAWRELQAALKAGAWALAGDCPHFPLAYHWRVMPRAAHPVLAAEQQAWLDRAPDYWGHSDAVRARLEGISAASASIVLFLECVPQTLDQWLKTKQKGAPSDPALEATILRFHDQWRGAAAFLNDRGMLHFDLNAYNVLTDGEQLYAADFGLALASDFDLSPAERTFFEAHRLYDRSYVDWAFIEWLTGTSDPPTLTPTLSALEARCAPVAAIFGNFLRTLVNGSKTAPFPAAELEAARAAPRQG
jgi:hypothetical protein